MASQRAPKQWQLTKTETTNSVESWRQNLMYIFSLDNTFSAFLDPDFTWQKKSAQNPNRGFTSDGADVIGGRTAAQKCAQLEMMLGQIANYCTIISRNTIVKNSTSLRDIWQKIREHYGFQSTGSYFLDLSSITLKPDERPEDLYQRLMAFFDDNLLTVSGGLTHHGERVTQDEDMSPTLENTIVYLWLQLVHPGLPQLIKQKYGSELRHKTISSLKPEISQSLTTLLDELRCIEDSKAMRAVSRRPQSQSLPTRFNATTKKRPKSCCLCKASGRPWSSHFLSECTYLPDSDRKYFGISRLILEEDGEGEEEDYYYTQSMPDDDEPEPVPSARRVDVVQSPYMTTYFNNLPVRITLDTGATTNMVLASFACAINLPIKPTRQKARQADGVTPLEVTGEVHCVVSRKGQTFSLDALVVKQLDVDVLAGNPFLVKNDIGVLPARSQILIGDDVISYGPQKEVHTSTVRRTQSYLLRAPPQQTTILPGECLDVHTPNYTDPDGEWALEPRLDSPLNQHQKSERVWPQPQEITSVDNVLRLKNDSGEPILLKRNEHFCQIRALSSPDPSQAPDNEPNPKFKVKLSPQPPFSSEIRVDPDNILSDNMKQKFQDLNYQYDCVFNPSIPRYNGASGPLEATVNMGPTLPPQRKGRIPQYNRSTMVELQEKFDELESYGVFAKPEDVGVVVEYLNPSFLVRKPNGGSRLVTSFGEVGKYSKPPPALMPNVDSVLRDISKWRYIIVTDLSKSFYQIPLAHSSMKYCGVVTPFKGVRVYTRSAMGMPGSETYLEELLSRVVGDLIQEGRLAKIADDMFCGGDTPEEALYNWGLLLARLKENNLGISAPKTVICPRSTTTLGWIWSSGTLMASPHKVSALAAVEPPSTVQGLRSFIGAYKVLSRVLKNYAELLYPLEQLTAGRESKEKLEWTSELIELFRVAQKALQNCKQITMPRAEDSLWIVTDAAVGSGGLAATLYALRDGKLMLCGFFNAKLKKHQVAWLPCEIEALSISAAVRQFAPFIVQSHQVTQVLTDSKPCVQAYSKLCRGEFSASARVTTFLATVSRYHVHVRHVSGAANLPSDYTSRHPAECTDASCQVCKFVAAAEESVVRGLSVKEVLDGSMKMPFTSRAAWLATQQECQSLRRTHSHLTQGTRPSKKSTRLTDVKRYLRCVVVSRDGVLVVRDEQPFQPLREKIVVPRSILEGLLTALHIKFHHPSQNQLKQVFTRSFYALDLDRAVGLATESCHQCSSLKSVPTHLHPQTSTPPPDVIGAQFAADVVKRHRQLILLVRETVSSFTTSCFLESEQHQQLRDGILSLCAELRSLGDGGCRVRVDPAPGFQALVDDPLLKQYGVTLDIGQAKNINKNPVAENAVREFGLECLNIAPEGGPLSKVSLALATANMNTRIRTNGLSAREIWTQRDQLTGEQLPITDRQIILQKQLSRHLNHPSSAKSKARGRGPPSYQSLQVGDLVYIKGDRDKTRARDKYMVCSVRDDKCQVRKFSQSQFRSKTYDMRTCDCYPVTPNNLDSGSHGPVRGLHKDSTPNDSEDCIPQQPSYTTIQSEPTMECMNEQVPDPQSQPDIPPDISVPPMEPDPPVPPTDTGSHMDETPTMTSMEPPSVPEASALPSPRRSTRSRKKPLWQSSDEWDMN